MRTEKKIPAFTLFELTVSMLLSVIVTALIYTAWLYTTRAYQQFDERNQKISELLRTERVITRDIETASLVRKTTEGFEMLHPSGLVSYTTGPDFLIRATNSIMKDTIESGEKQVQSSFDGNPVSPQAVIDRLRIPLMINREELTLSFTKQYSAEELMTPEK